MELYLIALGILASAGATGFAAYRSTGMHGSRYRRAQELASLALKQIEARREPIPAEDGWSRIARFVPSVREDLECLRDHWNAIDASLDVNGLTTEEQALRRALRNDLPRIAETLEGAMAIAATDDERRMACARALGSVEDLLGILKAHRLTIFEAACTDQQVVGRYLETKRGDVAPSGPLALDAAVKDVRPTIAGPAVVAERIVADDGCVMTTSVVNGVRRLDGSPSCSLCGVSDGGSRLSVRGGPAICLPCAEDRAATESRNMLDEMEAKNTLADRRSGRRKFVQRDVWDDDDLLDVG